MMNFGFPELLLALLALLLVVAAVIDVRTFTISNRLSLAKPLAEIATGKLAAPFNTLVNMVLSHASEDAADGGADKVSGSRSLVDNLRSMLAKMINFEI